MLEVEDIMRCCRHYDAEPEENHLVTQSNSEMRDHLAWLPPVIVPNISFMDHCQWDTRCTFGHGGSARESALKEAQNKTASFYCRAEVTRTSTRSSLQVLRDQLAILDDWATALHAYHVDGDIHGNLTPKSVGIVHGRGTLINPGLGDPLDRDLSWTCGTSDDDVYAARWAATELFHFEDGIPIPTKMGDVYSFGCLMLQMLTGEVPYCGTKRPEQVVYLKHLGREPIDTQTPKVADHYIAFMRWCWSPEPENRPTMDVVVDFIHQEIKRLVGQRG